MTERDKIDHLIQPDFFEENRLKACSDHVWYESEEDAICEREMDLSISLDGVWKFLYAPNPAAVPKGFEEEDYVCTGWGTIPVPGQMELNGYGFPQYTDTDYPWDGLEEVKPHQVPLEKNPTGCYVRYFDIPTHMEGKRIQLHFEGVETAFHCWLNGEYIGYSEDSYTPAVFDISEKVKEGKNKLAVEVYRFSTGSWLEDQDFWRMGGIIREVRITALPKIHMRDVDASVDVKDNYKTGILHTTIQMDTEKEKQKYGFEWKLFSPEGACVSQGDAQGEGMSSITFKAEVSEARLWSAEIPDLYQLLMTVSDETGQVIEAVSQKIGFRKIEIKEAVLYINGKRMILNGVNRHEFSPRKGRAIGKAEMEWDIRCLKKYNINAVRTSHYPNQSYWYKLCDQLGVYVMDEANLETHGTWHLQKFEHTLPGDYPEWKEACLSRAREMVERDKNHPSIFSWSVGNESWSGQTLYDMSCYMRERDPSRPVHYENVCHDRKWGATTDFESRMYASPAVSEAYLSDNPQKPYLLCEYSHGMGNSCGNLHEYVELLDKYPQYCGGFIWDYIDQSLYKKNPFGEEVLAYGGDFGDRPNNANFCTDGLIYGDRGISPKMQEVKYLYQPYRLYPEETGIKVESRMLFHEGENLYLDWWLEKEGAVLKRGRIPFKAQPETETFFKCDLSLPQGEGEYTRNAALVLAEGNAYADAGWEVCFGQSVDRKVCAEESVGQDETFPVIIDGDSTFSIASDLIKTQFKKLSGTLASYKIGQKELVYHGADSLKPNFWRAPTDNDEGNHMKERCSFWKTASLYPGFKKMQQSQNAHSCNVEVEYDLGDAASLKIEYKMFGNGTMEVTQYYKGEKELPEMPCYGMDWKLPLEFDQVRWCGLGPAETYADRKKGGRLSVYETTPQAEMPGYVVPQECGNHTDVRWIELTEASGVGVRIESDIPFEFSALPHTCHELEQARHLYELPRPYATVLRLNACQTGVGGDNSWGAWSHDDYIVRSHGEKRFCFRIVPIEKRSR